ncbi:sporulation domain-containing protein [Raoultella ornithinolytica]|nr:sporulation domain-containing protein [Raoultella ornithinolytica]
MASKFQNRLVGTIVLVALGVIILPGLLDGQKKHYQDEFAAIPLVPKPGDRDEPDMLPAATQALPAQPPEGAAEEVRAGDAAAPSLDPSRIPVNSNSFDDVQEPVVAPSRSPNRSLNRNRSLSRRSRWRSRSRSNKPLPRRRRRNRPRYLLRPAKPMWCSSVR